MLYHQIGRLTLTVFPKGVWAWMGRKVQTQMCLGRASGSGKKISRVGLQTKRGLRCIWRLAAALPEDRAVLQAAEEEVGAALGASGVPIALRLPGPPATKGNSYRT